AAAVLRPRLGRPRQRGGAQRDLLPGPEARRHQRRDAPVRFRRPRLRRAPGRRTLRRLDADVRRLAAEPGTAPPQPRALTRLGGGKELEQFATALSWRSAALAATMRGRPPGGHGSPHRWTS